MTCDRCGAALQVGMYPFCKGTPEGHVGATFHAQADDVPGGFWVENAWREPRWFSSQSSYEQALDADGLMLKPHYVPGSKHLSNWATTDPQTLENARILVERQGTAKEPVVVCETARFTTRVLESTVRVRAER